MKVKEETLKLVSDFFKLISDPTRMKILLLLQDEEISVGDIADRLNMTHSAVSHQLRILRHGKLVDYRREKNTFYYRLIDDHVYSIYKDAIEHVLE